MKSKNIFNKMFIVLAVIIIPLMITIGLAAWIMISEERIKPKYNPNSAFYVYLHEQETTYNGYPQLPSSTFITIDETVTYEYRKVGEANYTDGAPTNAGEYYIKFSSSKDETEGGYPTSDVYFKINKATPTVDSWPTFNAMYWGNTLEYLTEGSSKINGSFYAVEGSFALKAGKERTNPDLPYTVNILFTPEDTENYNTLTQPVDIILKAVANVGTVFYSTLDEAIENTDSGTIYAMLTGEGSDKAKTIGATTSNTSITLANGVTLYIPYAMDTTTTPYTYNVTQTETQTNINNLKEFGELYHGSAENFADSVPNNTYLKNYIMIDSDTTLNISNGATLQVTGIIGNSSSSLQGQTSREYAEVRMISSSKTGELVGSKIYNLGVIICGGYIKEVDDDLNYITYPKSVSSDPFISKITILSSGDDIGEIRLPFVISDYRGGTSTAGSYANASAADVLFGNYKGNISPFSRYDFPNVQTRLEVLYGGQVKGYADLYTGEFKINIPIIGEVGTNAQHNLTNISVIGTTNESLIKMYPGTVITCDCVPTDPGVTTTAINSRKNFISMTGTGGATLNALVMEINVVGTIRVTTADVLFPLNDLYDISLSGGTYDISTGFKMLPGSKITVNYGADLNIGSDFIIYSDFDDKALISPLYPTSTQLGTTGADLIINGTLNIGSNARFGGHVKTAGTNGIMNVATSNLSITSKEGTGARDGISFVFNESNSITEKFKGNIYKNGVIDNNLTNLSQGTYYSIQGSDGNYGWYADNATIYYNANGGTLNGVSSSGPYTTGNTGHPLELSSIDQTIPSREHYTFAGWYLAQECNDSDALFTWNGKAFTKVKDYNMYVNTTLYAKWIPIEYTITYGNSYTFTGGSGSFSTNTNLTSFTYETANVLLTKPAHANGYVFEGWYYTSDNTKLTMLNGSELVNYLSSNNVNIYAKWYPAGTETFTVNYVNERNDEIPCLESQDLIIETDASWSNYSLPNIGYNNNITTYQYYFAGWYTTETYNEGTLVTYLSEELFSSSTTITLYAKWEVKHTVVLDWGEDDIASVIYYIANGSTFEFPSLEDFFSVKEENTKITLNIHKWFDGANLYEGLTASPPIIDDITFIVKNDPIQFTQFLLKNEKSSITLTTNTGYYIISNTNTFEKLSTYSTSDNDISVFIQVGANLLLNFSYNTGKYNGYEIQENGKRLVRNEDGGTSYTISKVNLSSYQVAASSGNSSGICIFGDSQVVMADGTTKLVSEVKVGDMVTTWSFEEGKFVSRPVIFLESLKSQFAIEIKLYFDDGTTIRIAGAQSYFDMDKLEYFSINDQNAFDFIGVNILTYDNGIPSSKRIIDCEINLAIEDVYEIITGYDYSFIYDNVLTMEPFMLYKLPFKIDSDLKYDEELMKEDIEKYGLYTYDEWYMHGTEQMFDLMNVKYFKVAIEKGLYTLEYLLELYEHYFIPDNLN